MNRFWNNHKWAIGVFATIFLVAVLFPYVLDLSANYYMTHPVEIPAFVRALMGLALLVRVLRLPIILVAGAVIFVISLVRRPREHA